MIKKSEFTPYVIQTRIDESERLQRARDLHKAEKENKVIEAMDVFYTGELTDNEFNFDRKEIHDYMSLD